MLNLRYPGQYYDAESGLVHNGFRDYCPVCGRYIQSDPIGLAGGISNFGYAGNNPLNSYDPTGKDAILLINPSGAYLGPLMSGTYGGHAGIAVGNDDTGWNYYSEGGMDGDHQITTTEQFPDLASLENALCATYTQQMGEHTQPLQDMLMNTWARRHLKDPYSGPHNNCGDFAMGVLRAGGLHPTANGLGPTIPNNLSITDDPNDPNLFSPDDPYNDHSMQMNPPHYESPAESIRQDSGTNPLSSGANPVSH